MERYDKSLIAVAISKSIPCDLCPYPCKAKEKSSMYNCELHWEKILDLISYKSDPHFDPHKTNINDTK